MREPVTHKLRADFSDAREDLTIDFSWDSFTKEDHAMWKFLFERQTKLLQGRACEQFLEGIRLLGFEANEIPNYERVSERLFALSGFRLVVVPGYLPGDVFHAHLAKRQFPVTTFIRRPDQIDYLKEPDIFHDLFGHVPLLAHPSFAEYMQAFGEGGVRAHKLGFIDELDTLYWFTVEFGLIRSDKGLRIYGAGILSSKGESIYALESDKPNRLAYDLRRIMRTAYRIDEFQRTYFAIDSFDALMRSTSVDFLPIYQEVQGIPHVPLGELRQGDTIVERTR